MCQALSAICPFSFLPAAQIICWSRSRLLSHHVSSASPPAQSAGPQCPHLQVITPGCRILAAFCLWLASLFSHLFLRRRQWELPYVSKGSSGGVIPLLSPLQWLPIALCVEDDNLYRGLLGVHGLPRASLTSSRTRSALSSSLSLSSDLLAVSQLSASELLPRDFRTSNSLLLECSLTTWFSPACSLSKCCFVSEGLPGTPSYT